MSGTAAGSLSGTRTIATAPALPGYVPRPSSWADAMGADVTIRPATAADERPGGVLRLSDVVYGFEPGDAERHVEAWITELTAQDSRSAGRALDPDCRAKAFGRKSAAVTAAPMRVAAWDHDPVPPWRLIAVFDRSPPRSRPRSVSGG